MADVVVLPCMPATTIPRFPAMIAASASALRAIGCAAIRAAARIGLVSLMADEKITRSASRASSARCSARKRSPSRCNRSVSNEPALSEPLTSWPSSSKSAAIPLMPLPATPTRWIRWRSRVSNGCRLTSEASVMSRLRISFHRFHDERSRVFRREPRRIFRHALQLIWIVDQSANLLRQRIRREVGFL